MRGVVHAAGGGVYRIGLLDGRLVEASLRGRLKTVSRTGDKVVIGDRVRVEPGAEGHFTIDEIEPRETLIVRRGPGGRGAKVVAANVERMVIVVAAADPPPGLPQIDRLLVVAESNGVSPVLVVNKIDLPAGADMVGKLEALYGNVGYRVLAVSALSGTGLAAFRKVVCEGCSALVGPSGAGKSSLLNALDPGLDLRTGELSGKGRRGRHTTVSSRLVPLACGGLVADTPGFAEVGVWGVAADQIERCFPEVEAVARECRFEDCAHLAEPDCAVRRAMADGRIAFSRYDSYRRLIEEARAAGPAG